MNGFNLGKCVPLAIGAFALVSSLSLVSAKADDSISFRTYLINPQHEASESAVGVKVSDVKGVKLVDPDKEHEIAKKGQAHIHYQLDNGPIVATPDTKITFHGLTPGKHVVTITLAGNNHEALTEPQKLEIEIPAAAG